MFRDAESRNKRDNLNPFSFFYNYYVINNRRVLTIDVFPRVALEAASCEVIIARR